MTITSYAEAPARPDRIRICVIDSRTGAAYPRLAECPDLEVIGKVPWLDLRFLPPQLLADAAVVLVGLDPAELEEAAWQAQLRRLAELATVIAITTGPCRPEAVAHLGVRGLVARDVGPDALTRVVRAAAAGEMAFPRSAFAALLEFVRGLSLPLPGVSSSPLTPRQREVVALIAAGATDREVARRLRISESTAHKHVQNALRRSRAKTRSQLVALVRQQPLAAL